MVKELTPRQEQVLKYVETYWQSHAVAPSIANIAQGLSIGRASAYEHLLALKRKGSLDHQDGISRTWRPQGLSVPVLGTVAAGLPILAYEDVKEWIDVAFNPSDELFALKIQGDSMIDAHIMEDDLIVVRRQASAQDGDIIVALIDGEEATVKQLHRKNNIVRLIPKNTRWSPMEFSPERVQILGKVVEVRRRL